MSNEVEQANPAVLELPPIAQNLQLIARSADEMKVAQRSMVDWFERKKAELQADVAELDENIEIAKENGWKVSTLQRHRNLAAKRVEFYERCRVASAAGYAIVPNFPVDFFAIRTEATKPQEFDSNSRFENREQTSEGPPVGEGEYVDAQPKIEQRVEVVRVDPATGAVKETERWFKAIEFQAVDFPFSVAKPEIMNATAEAMALKCFDEMGVLPARRRKGDPIVVGVIRDPRSTPGYPRLITFLVAWYVDTSAF